MFKVLHSSAGAGKTHALVKHYLLLALRTTDASTYAHILALTFTNKAAAEMRERVLVYLEALANGEELEGAKADVRNSVMAEANINAEELDRRAKAMLTHMLHHWSQVAISTIDAFTRRVVQPFARDLQLDQELNMTMEEEYYRAKAVDLLLEEAGNEPALTKILVATCEQLLEEEKAWRPDRPLLELSKQLTQENALEHLNKLKEIDSAEFMAMHKRLRERTNAFRDRMRKLGQDALAAIEQAGLTPEDLAYGKNGFLSYFRNLSTFDTKFAKSKRAENAARDDKWHSATATPIARDAINGIASILRDTYNLVEGLRNTKIRDYIIAVAVYRELLTTASLNSIDQRLEALKREEGVSFFSDLTRRVHAIVQDEPAPFIYERLGEKYTHFLIDEFQDTSLMQWHALLPLVTNALSTDGTVLLVGDAKQAIYRWRNGEARQFVEMPTIFRKELLTHGTEFESALMRANAFIDPLDHNHRSAKSIIEFNNDLTERLKSELDEKERKVFDRHEQKFVRKDEGYVEVSCYEKAEEGEVAAPWTLMVKAVNDCLADGFHLGDIAVLVRTKKQGGLASDHLTAECWNVVSPDGLTLGGNPGACAVVHILAWLQRPMDENAALAAQSIATLQAGTGTVDPFSAHEAPQVVLRHWRSAHPRISARLPLVTLICRIAEALHHDPASDVFIMALVNEAHAFSKAGGDDLPGFLEHWDRTLKGRSIGGTPNSDAIQVMTVHKAKGLAFPVVIIPEAGKASRGGGGERVWISPTGELDVPPSALVKMSKQLTDLEVPELVKEASLAKLDDLNVLYVALTRAEERMYISVAGSGNDALPKAIREHLELEPGPPAVFGKRETRRSKTEKTMASSASRDLELTASPPQGERELAIRCEAPTGWDPADPDPYRSHGRAVHAMLARVHTPKDLPEAVRKESANWGLEPATSTALGLQLAALLAKPAIAPFFHEGLEVHTESTLLTADGRAMRPDRVVRDGDLFRVLDIKTGAPSATHKEQVRDYVQLLHGVEGRPVEGYLLYVSDGIVVPVET